MHCLIKMHKTVIVRPRDSYLIASSNDTESGILNSAHIFRGALNLLNLSNNF
jgi:hypothetical protein